MFCRATHEPLCEYVYQEIKVTSGIIHGVLVPRESVPLLFVCVIAQVCGQPRWLDIGLVLFLRVYVP